MKLSHILVTSFPALKLKFDMNIQTLQKKQQDTKKLASLSNQSEREARELEQKVAQMKHQQSQIQKRLCEESEKKKKNRKQRRRLWWRWLEKVGWIVGWTRGRTGREDQGRENGVIYHPCRECNAGTVEKKATSGVIVRNGEGTRSTRKPNHTTLRTRGVRGSIPWGSNINNQ